MLPELRAGRSLVYIDTDPAYTQLRLALGNEGLRSTLREHTHFFTFGENIGTVHSPLPTGGFAWRPTRQPVVLGFWTNADAPGCAYTTVGRWDAGERDIIYQGETFRWSKRTEWLGYLDLPSRTGLPFELAMDVWRVPGDEELLTAHGWRIINPYAISSNPWRYRDYLRRSRGEFTVAKDMNIRLRSGWFSDRAASYLAAGRPVVEQDTGFGMTLPVGPGLHAFRTIDEVMEAIKQIEADYTSASRHAYAIACEYFAAQKVLSQLLSDIGV
jgi:hypothetical protein